MNQITAIRRPRREDLIKLARESFNAGRFDSIEDLAARLGISRATAYNWVGNSDHLLQEILCDQTHDLFTRAASSRMDRGKNRICGVLMEVSKAVLQHRAFLQLFEKNPEKMLRLVASKNGPVQKIAIDRTESLIHREIESGFLDIALDSHTMAYVLVRMCESFLFSELITGETFDLDKLETTIDALLSPQ